MNDMVKLEITVPAETLETARATADELNMSVDEYLRLAIAAGPPLDWDLAEDPDVAVSVRLTDAVEALEAAVAAMDLPGGYGLDLSDLRTVVSNMINRLRREEHEMVECWGAIECDAQLAVSFGVQPWTPPLSPQALLRALGLARRGAPVTVTYRQALRQAREERDRQARDKRDQRDSTKCPHPGCGGSRVRRAGGVRTEVCWSHLTDEQKAEIKQERERAIERPCPNCHAAAGEPCTSYGRPTTIHHGRLNPHVGQVAP